MKIFTKHYFLMLIAFFKMELSYPKLAISGIVDRRLLHVDQGNLI